MQFLMIAAAMSAAAAQSASDDGLTLAEIVANIPHDGPAIVLYALIVGSVALIWRSGRSKPPAAPGV